MRLKFGKELDRPRRAPKVNAPTETPMFVGEFAMLTYDSADVCLPYPH